MKKYGLIGRNISYSFSKRYFEEKFAKENITDSSYTVFDIPSIEDIKTILLDTDLKGLNVTIPYKVEVIPFLDVIDPAAERVGAVNTIKILPDGRLYGANTDVYGFQKALSPYLETHHDKALILGSGGASKAVAYVLESLGIEYWHVSREKTSERKLSYDTLAAVHVRSCPLIINCTPLGTSPNVDVCPDIPYELLDDRNLLFDLVYNPLETLFMRKGAQRGAVTVGGLTMLKLQAEKSWEIWQKDN